MSGKFKTYKFNGQIFFIERRSVFAADVGVNIVKMRVVPNNIMFF